MKTHVRSLAAVAALLVLVLALPVAGQGIVITSPSGGTQTSVVGTTSSCSVGAPDAANSVCLGSNTITGEGATADTSETVLAFGDASADNTLTLKGTAAGVEATVTTGALLTGAGTGTGRVSVGGVLCKGAPSPGTTSGTSEEVIATCPIPANTLSTDGMALEVSYFGHYAANTNNKTLRIRVGGIGGLIVLDSGAVASNNLNFGNAVGEIKRASATTASVKFLGWTSSNSATATLTSNQYSFLRPASASITWANANDLVVTAIDATAAGGTILEGLTVRVVQ